MSLSEELQWRGFVNQTTYSDISVLDGQPITFYWGVDPSAPSMTIGNLATAMMVRHFIEHGHKAVLLVGGATGLIGDPDGKSEERDLKPVDEVQKNVDGIVGQYKKVFAGHHFDLVNNYDWFKSIGFLEFLRDIGKHVPMRQMLGREFVQSRLSEDGAGISYAEFSYSLIQGYDFLHLYREHGVTLQVCGADQWGNSIAGVELIRRVAGGEAHIWSAPLVVNKATGKKFGKSEDGAVWLNPDMTSVYRFYQFWINLDDEGVEDYLKIYTMLNREELADLMAEHRENPGLRAAQKRLAYEVTAIVHGESRAMSVKSASEVLFGLKPYAELNKHDFEELDGELPRVDARAGETSLIDVLVETGLAQSKSEARRFLDESAVYINGMQFSLEKTTFDEHDNLHGYAVIRRGKNTSALVRFK